MITYRENMKHLSGQNLTTPYLRRPLLSATAALMLFLVGCSAPETAPRNDTDPHAGRDIIETYETARLRAQEHTPPEDPAPPAGEEDVKPDVVRTSHFDFFDNRVYHFLRASLQAKLSGHVPFTKWVPEAFSNGVITYQTFGLGATDNVVFDRIMAELADRTGLALVRDVSGAATNLNFAYVYFLIEAQQLAPMAGKLDDQIERENKRLLEYPLEPELAVRRWDNTRDKNGVEVLSA